MSPNVSPLGYINSNYLYRMVLNNKKITTTARQITTATTRNIANVFTTNTTDNITTDASKTEISTKTEFPELDTISPLVMAITMALFLSIVFIFVWWVERRSWPFNSRSSPRETSPLLPHKTAAGGQYGGGPPSYASRSPSHPSPQAYEELHLVAGSRCKRPSPC